ncbi:hypothetical protein DVH24_025778 [Malus domestica]|uniref:Uncharacterized protein n=1 Tax=Malus domestica TaxID=3750 RepID=A0A498KLX1_MALDO|nr:hypothetical protein DVH24_025778 [Malus domestica]
MRSLKARNLDQKAAPKSRTRDLPPMGEGTCHRTKCDLLILFGIACKDLVLNQRLVDQQQLANEFLKLIG